MLITPAISFGSLDKLKKRKEALDQQKQAEWDAAKALQAQAELDYKAEISRLAYDVRLCEVVVEAKGKAEALTIADFLRAFADVVIKHGTVENNKRTINSIQLYDVEYNLGFPVTNTRATEVLKAMGLIEKIDVDHSDAPRPSVTTYTLSKKLLDVSRELQNY